MDTSDETLKISVFTKLKKVNHLIREVTLGPDSILLTEKGEEAKESENNNVDTTIEQTTEIEKTKNSYNKYCSNSLPAREFIKLIELDHQRDLQDSIKERLHVIEQFQKLQIARTKENEINRMEALANKIKTEEIHMQKMCKEFEEKLAIQQAALAKQIEKNRQDIKMQLVQNRYREKIQDNIKAFSSKYQEIVDLLNNFEYREHLEFFPDIDLNAMYSLYVAMEEIEQKIDINGGTNSVKIISETDVDASSDILVNLEDLKENFRYILDMITDKINEIKSSKLQENVEVSSDAADQLHSGELSEISDNVDTYSEIFVPENEYIDPENYVYQNTEVCDDQYIEEYSLQHQNSSGNYPSSEDTIQYVATDSALNNSRNIENTSSNTPNQIEIVKNEISSVDNEGNNSNVQITEIEGERILVGDIEGINTENYIFENTDQQYVQNPTEKSLENTLTNHTISEQTIQHITTDPALNAENAKTLAPNEINPEDYIYENTNYQEYVENDAARQMYDLDNLEENFSKLQDPVESNSAKFVETANKITVTGGETEVLKKKEEIEIVDRQDAKTTSSDLKSELEKLWKYVSFNDLHNYTEILDYLGNYRKKFENLENDVRLKDFIFGLKKAVNIPVNSLSDVNLDHIKDKYQKLYDLLSGGKVYINRKEICAAQHPEGIAFCVNLLARRIVLQGDLMVSSNPKSAFCYASLVLTLWNDFPEFGKILLAYFYIMCPYLVPYYIPREVNQTDEDFYIKLGYQYVDGEIEKQDKFLKRMRGIIGLYFAILISKPLDRKPSPYNIKNAWKWMASFLKLEPQMDISATALCVFLETAGDTMAKTYGQIFNKIIQSIVQIYYPKCCEVKCTGGAVTKLELLLKQYAEVGHFANNEN